MLKEELSTTREELRETKERAEATELEKNEMISTLTHRIESMESSYEHVLNDALDAMASKVRLAKGHYIL